MGILLSVLSGILLLVNGITCSIGSENKKQIYIFNFFAPLFTLLLAAVIRVKWSVVLNGGVIYPYRTLIVLLISSLCGLGYVMMLMFAMNTGPHALSLCIGESCLVIPYLFSVLIWQDRLTIKGVIGVILITASIIVIGYLKDNNIKKSDLSAKWFIFILLALLFGGMELTLYTIPSRWVGWSDVANIRPAVIQIGRFAILIPLLIKKIKLRKKTIIISLIAAAFNLLVIVAQFKAMDYLVKDGMLAVLYPIAMGTYILLFTAYGYFYRKETLNKSALLSMSAILVGIILLGL